MIYVEKRFIGQSYSEEKNEKKIKKKINDSDKRKNIYGRGTLKR